MLTHWPPGQRAIHRDACEPWVLEAALRRRSRLVWRSRGFLTKSKDRLWQEQRAEWYPQPAAGAIQHVEASSPDTTQIAGNSATNPTAARCVGPCSRLRVAVATPAAFGRSVQPLHGV